MSRYTLSAFAFLLSFTGAQAGEGQSYFGVSAIMSGKIDYDSSEFFDNEVNSGFIFTYGRGLSDNLDMEFSYVRYLDLNLAEGFLKEELTAIEVAALLRTQKTGPFFRLGYSNAEESLSSDTIDDIDSNSDDSGLIYGAGFDFDIGNDAGKLRLEYTIGDYDDGEIKRITIGTLVNF